MKIFAYDDQFDAAGVVRNHQNVKNKLCGDHSTSLEDHDLVVFCSCDIRNCLCNYWYKNCVVAADRSLLPTDRSTMPPKPSVKNTGKPAKMPPQRKSNRAAASSAKGAAASPAGAARSRASASRDQSLSSYSSAISNKRCPPLPDLLKTRGGSPKSGSPMDQDEDGAESADFQRGIDLDVDAEEFDSAYTKVLQWKSGCLRFALVSRRIHRLSGKIRNEISRTMVAC